jgi:hypothetical protein
MPTRPLLEIIVEHPFFTSGVFTEARVEPDPTTAVMLRHLRLVAKPIAGRLAVLVDLDAGGIPRIPVPTARLCFQLQRLPDELAQASDLTLLQAGAIFTDKGAAASPLQLMIPDARRSEVLEKPVGAVTLVLSGRPRIGASPADFVVVPPAGGIRVTGYDAAGNRVAVDGPEGIITISYPVTLPRTTGTTATLEITIGSETVAQAAAGAPRRVVVPLQPASARWCYHIVTNLPDPLSEWRMARSNGAATDPAISFGDAGRTEITVNTPDDSFGTWLHSRVAPLRVLRFVSDAPVACSERILRRLTLSAGGAQLFGSLPNPSPAQVRRIRGEIVYSEVLRVVTV